MPGRMTVIGAYLSGGAGCGGGNTVPVVIQGDRPVLFLKGPLIHSGRATGDSR